MDVDIKMLQTELSFILVRCSYLLEENPFKYDILTEFTKPNNVFDPAISADSYCVVPTRVVYPL